MLPMGSIFFPLIVAPLKAYKPLFPLCLNILYRTKDDFRQYRLHTKDVCLFIAYCVAEL